MDMKKLMLLVALAFGLSFAQAQSDGPELGVRFGGGYGANLNAIDGVLPLGDVNRLHADLAFGNRVLSLDGLYEWQFAIGEGFTVYPGVGGSFWSWRGSDYINGAGQKVSTGSYSTIAILGVIGIEYQIEPIPLTVGLDFRPAIGLTNDAGYGNGWGLMCRYRF